VPVFPSEEWTAAWVALANGSEEFEASGRGFSGTIVLVVEADQCAASSGPVYLRLAGTEGKWVNHDFGRSEMLLEGASFVLRGPYRDWKTLIRQEIHPIKALLQGKIRIRGHLPEFLKWTRAMTILTELAGEIDTEFVDEPPLSSPGR
jgi:putative sterol carrier protein